MIDIINDYNDANKIKINDNITFLNKDLNIITELDANINNALNCYDDFDLVKYYIDRYESLKEEIEVELTEYTETNTNFINYFEDLIITEFNELEDKFNNMNLYEI